MAGRSATVNQARGHGGFGRCSTGSCAARCRSTGAGWRTRDNRSHLDDEGTTMKGAYLAVAAVMFASIASAQPPAAGQAQAPAGRGGQQQQAPRNLQVLSKDAPVLPAMQQITLALGVTCDYCHVQDRAADDKQTKKTARQMMILAREINQKLPAPVGKA